MTTALSPFRLPGGRIVMIQEELTRGLDWITFTVKGGEVVIATRATTAEIVADVAQTHPITVLQLEPLLTICSWCDPQHTATRALKDAGIVALSHGICATHEARVFGDTRSAA